jgi:hypothetical protein
MTPFPRQCRDCLPRVALEVATIAPIQDGDYWTRFDAARRALAPKFANSAPAPRYRAAGPARKIA